MYWSRFRNIQVGDKFQLDGKECTKTSDSTFIKSFSMEGNQKIQTDKPITVHQLIPGDYFMSDGIRYIRVNQCAATCQHNAFCVDTSKFVSILHGVEVQLL